MSARIINSKSFLERLTENKKVLTILPVIALFLFLIGEVVLLQNANFDSRSSAAANNKNKRPTPTPTIPTAPSPTSPPIATPTRLPSPTPAGQLPSPSPIPTTFVPSPTTQVPTPTTPPQSGGAVIAAVGDIACDSNTSTSITCQQRATSDLVLAMSPAPSAVLALGDNQYNSGEYQNFLNYYDPTWGRLKAKTYPVVGNHEYGTSGAAGYFDYYNGVGQQTGRAGERGKGYYSFDIGTWHVIALNSQCTKINGGCTAGSPQEQWLRQDLASHTNTCTLAYLHEPLYTSGTVAGTVDVRPLYQALYDYNADLILAGHKHMYERFAPQDANGNLNTARGIRQITVGTGGRDLTNVSNISYPNLEIRNGKSFGVLRVALSSNSYSWNFLPIPGMTFTDSGTGQCH